MSDIPIANRPPEELGDFIDKLAEQEGVNPIPEEFRTPVSGFVEGSDGGQVPMPPNAGTGQFQSPFPVHGPAKHDPGEPYLPPISPDPDVFGQMDPGRVPGPFGSTFTLEQLRETLETDRYVYEWKRIRSQSPCRTCKNGNELFGVAELQSQSFTGIARKLICDRFKSDVTNNAIISCSAHEADAAKSGIRSIRQIEADLRSRYKLSGPKADKWTQAEIAEEESFADGGNGVRFIRDEPGDEKSGIDELEHPPWED